MKSINKNSVVLLTGASGDIGKAIALSLAKFQCKLVLVGRDQKKLTQVSNQCLKLGAKIFTITYDFLDLLNLSKIVDAAVKQFKKIDVLINCHGIHTHKKVLEDENIINTINTNLVSTMLLTKHVLPYLINNKSPSTKAVIFISSIAAKVAMANNASYCASKHGINGFAHSLFEEVREYAIKVSSICPGYIATAMTKQLNLASNKMMSASDVADTVNFILSSSPRACPVEILLRPQFSPYK